jgi:hypothetical protein
MCFISSWHGLCLYISVDGEYQQPGAYRGTGAAIRHRTNLLC